MSDCLESFINYLPYIAIPFISGIIGWFTNTAALKMIFYPVDYIGYKPIGWQGIVPSRAKKMAELSVELMTNKLLDVKEIFSAIDSKEISKILKQDTDILSKEITDEIMNNQAPILWRITPKSYKQKIYKRVRAEVPAVIENIIIDFKENINELLDLKTLAVSVLLKNKELINKIFLEAGKKEFKFIERSGLYFGFLFGIFQMIIFIFYNPWWILPLAGILVGYLTNFLALKMIFRPVKPVKFLNIKIQGLFFKHQEEVADVYSRIVTDKILSTKNLFEFIINAPDQSKINNIIYSQTSKVVDNITISFRRILKILKNERKIKEIKKIISFRFKEEFIKKIDKFYPYVEKAINLQKIMFNKMAGLSSSEFESFLHPVFQEDEYKLILIGAFLGGLAGLLQFFIFFY